MALDNHQKSDLQPQDSNLRTLTVVRVASAFLLAAIGLPLLWWGARLAWLSGSIFYVVTGVLLFIAAVFAWRGDARALLLFAAATGANILWAIWEVGLEPWGLLARLSLLPLLALWFAVPAVNRNFLSRRSESAPRAALRAPLVFLALPLIAIILFSTAAWRTSFRPVPVEADKFTASADMVPDQTPRPSDWQFYGGNANSTRYAPLSQITPGNVGKLEVAWTYRTGINGPDMPPGIAGPKSFEATPLKVGDSLFLCTPYNVTISLNATTGKQLWRFDPHITRQRFTSVCRGVSYYPGSGSSASCDARIITATIDNQLIALDPTSGQPCEGFGEHGVVDFGQGSADPQHLVFTTSPPLVMGNLIILGSGVTDGQNNHEPSGVVRAFDVHSGKLAWAWDVLSSEPSQETDSSRYAADTPNAWGVFTGDTQLGLVYIPTGNSPPDYYGGGRTAEYDRYNASIVALDVATGKVRWSFQTAHHDVWDLDVASQPILVDIETAAGVRPAVIQPTKRGEIFVLDRRTGVPIFPVAERAVPQLQVSGERLSPTQPFNTNFANFEPARLEEADMWGGTILDQMLCRITYRSLDHEGLYTAATLRGSLEYPVSLGVFTWGSASVDPTRQLMLVNGNYQPFIVRLVPRAEADRQGAQEFDFSGRTKVIANPAESKYLWPQSGTPYAVNTLPFLSPLGLPCHTPPYGFIAAVDLRSGKTVWKRPLGTTRDAAPLGIALPTGVFNIGGAVVTRSGLAFIGAAIDNYIRAFDFRSGVLLWQARLPAGGQATPMTYVGGDGQQYVVIAAGGHRELATKQGDYVVAYRLPK